MAHCDGRRATLYKSPSMQEATVAYQVTVCGLCVFARLIAAQWEGIRGVQSPLKRILDDDGRSQASNRSQSLLF